MVSTSLPLGVIVSGYTLASYVVTVSASQTAPVVLFKRAGSEATLLNVADTLFPWHEIEAVNLTQGDDRTADGSQSRAAGGLTGVSQRCLLTGLNSSGPEVLDSIENLVPVSYTHLRLSSSNGPQFLPVAFLLRQELIISG